MHLENQEGGARHVHPEGTAAGWAQVCARHCVQRQPPRIMSKADTFSAEQWTSAKTEINANSYTPGNLTVTMHLTVDTLGIEPRASRMLSGCDTTTPHALDHK